MCMLSTLHVSSRNCDQRQWSIHSLFQYFFMPNWGKTLLEITILISWLSPKSLLFKLSFLILWAIRITSPYTFSGWVFIAICGSIQVPGIIWVLNILWTDINFQWQVNVFFYHFLSNSIVTSEWCVIYRADSRLAPSQWETSSQSNAVSNCLGANLESALSYVRHDNDSNVYVMITRLIWTSMSEKAIKLNYSPTDPISGGFPPQRPMMRGLMSSLLMVWESCWTNSREVWDARMLMWRHCTDNVIIDAEVPLA